MKIIRNRKDNIRRKRVRERKNSRNDIKRISRKRQRNIEREGEEEDVKRYLIQIGVALESEEFK